MGDSIGKLLKDCIAAHSRGADFPTFWKELLSQHPFVTGFPVQGKNKDTGPVLEVPLINGHRLVFDATGFHVER